MVKNRVENQVSTGKANRFMELEGLRVIAAVVVVLYHAALIFYPAYFYGLGSQWSPVQNLPLESVLYQNPFSGILSGTFAVGIFFVLSGFVLSISFFQKKGDPGIIKRLAAKRYPRLMFPALGSVIIAWLVMTLGMKGLPAAAQSITHSGWLESLWKIDPNLWNAFYQGFADIFTRGKVEYNPVLWTIQYELIGSFVIFGSLLLFAASKYRWVVYVFLVVGFAVAWTWLLGFIIGMIFADIYVNKQEWLKKINNVTAYVAILVGIVLGSYPSGEVTSPLYKALHVPGLQFDQQIAFYVTVGAALVVVASITSPVLSRFLGHPKLSRFGKYTYSLYLIHMPVLFTVCTGAFLLLVPIGFHKAAVLSISVTLAALIPLTFLFEKYIDSPSIRLSSYCADIFLGKKRLDFKKRYATLRLSIAAKTSTLRRRKMTDMMPEIEAE